MKHEVAVFSHYLVNRQPPAHAYALYTAKVAEVTADTIPANEQRQLDFALAHPWCVGLLDGGLALANPHAELRRRIYITFAILESSVEYHQLFLVRRRSALFIVYIAYVFVRSAIKAACGLALLSLLRMKP